MTLNEKLGRIGYEVKFEEITTSYIQTIQNFTVLTQPNTTAPREFANGFAKKGSLKYRVFLWGTDHIIWKIPQIQVWVLHFQATRLPIWLANTFSHLHF